MSFATNALRIMIASPGDVAEERKVVTEEILRWNDANAFARKLALLPVKWETHSTPQFGDHPQTIINRQLLDEVDIVVAIFGTRIGTPTEEYLSGTVEEIKKHVAAGKTAKVYFSDVPVSPSSLDPDQYKLLQQFRQECESTSLFATFNSIEQFRSLFSHHLDIELNQPRYLWLAVPDPTVQSRATDLNPDAIRLIKAAASSGDGMVIQQVTLGASGLSAGDVQFTDGSPRSDAKWRGIVGELLNQGILEETEGEGIFRLTDAGYEIADNAEASVPTEIALKVAGPAEGQFLHISSNRRILLVQLDFLTSTEACISTQKLSDEVGEEIEVRLAHGKIVELFNTPRPDRNSWDNSGPVKLRLSFQVDDRVQSVVLPVMLQPKLVNNTQWITLIGAQSFQIPAQKAG